MTKSTNTATLADEDSIEQQYGEGASKVQLRRWENNEWVFLAELSVPDATQPKIQTTYGGGRYRVRVYGADDKYTGKQFSFRIAGEPKLPSDKPAAPVTDAAAPPGVSDVSDFKKFVESMNNSGNEIAKIALAAALRPPPPPPPRDPMIETLLTAIISRDRSDGVDPLKLQELLQQAEERGEKRGRELGELSAGVAGEGGIAGVLASHLPSIAESFATAVGNAKRATPATPAIPATRAIPPAPAAPAIATTNSPTEANDVNAPAWLPYLRPTVPLLLKYARSGKDAQIKAANMIDDLSEENRRLIAAFAEAENFVDQVITHIPEFQAPELKEWFVVFFSTVQDMLTEPEEGSPMDNHDGSEEA